MCIRRARHCPRLTRRRPPSLSFSVLATVVIPATSFSTPRNVLATVHFLSKTMLCCRSYEARWVASENTDDIKVHFAAVQTRTITSTSHVSIFFFFFVSTRCCSAKLIFFLFFIIFLYPVKHNVLGHTCLKHAWQCAFWGAVLLAVLASGWTRTAMASGRSFLYILCWSGTSLTL